MDDGMRLPPEIEDAMVDLAGRIRRELARGTAAFRKESERHIVEIRELGAVVRAAERDARAAQEAVSELADIRAILDELPATQRGSGPVRLAERVQILASLNRTGGAYHAPDCVAERLAVDGDFHRWARLAHLDRRDGGRRAPEAIRAWLAEPTRQSSRSESS